MSIKEKMKEITRSVKKIASEFKPEKVILFGSFAYGKPKADSDVDLAVIKKSRKDFYQRNAEARLIVSDSSLPMDIFVFTPEEFNQKKQLIHL